MSEFSLPIQIIPVESETVVKFRDMYRQELDCQIVHDSGGALLAGKYQVPSDLGKRRFRSVWAIDLWRDFAAVNE